MTPTTVTLHTPGGYAAKTFAAMATLLQASARAPRLVVAPNSANASIAPSGSYTHQVSVPVGSALWAISATCDQTEGCTLNLLDAAGSPLANQAPYFASLSGAGAGVSYQDSRGGAHTILNRRFHLPKYQLVIEPGLLQVKIVNLSANSNKIRVGLYFSIPVAGAPRNAFDNQLDAELAIARRAIRNIDLTTGQAAPMPAAAAVGNPMQQPAINALFDFSTAGDHSAVLGVQGHFIAIHQLGFRSQADQTIRLLDKDADVYPPFDDYQGSFGLTYQDEPYFVLGAGNPFVINLAAGTGGNLGRLSGFLKYRVFDRWPL